MPSLWNRITGAFRGFREPVLSADPTGSGWGWGGHQGGHRNGSDWSECESRRLRYRLLWAFYEQTAYRDISGWPQQFRATYGLYEGIRDLFGVAHQLGEFWASHLQGGDLDPLAGDGKTAPSVLPILMDRESPLVRSALAELWKRSNLQIAKDIVNRLGAVTGDAFYEICDDAAAETVRLRPVAPGKVKWCDLSPEGNVLAYELEYGRPDPRQTPSEETLYRPRTPHVRYTEVVTPEQNGSGVRWKTYLDGELYLWPGNPGSQWTIPDLSFVPLVKIQHKNIGLGWGQSESIAALSGMREVADLSSCLTDWARKACAAPHLMSGMKNPKDDPQATARANARPPTPAQRRSGYGGEFAGDEYGLGSGQSYVEASARNEANYLYSTNEAAKAHSLVHPLPVDGIGSQVDRLRAKTLEDYPELSFERIRTSGQASAEAIREARKPAEAKIIARRVEYDAGLARACRMALTLGGLRGYRHYEPFSAGSYDAGDLDFRIGPRPAFSIDPSEETADRLARYQALKAATDAGLPLELAMSEAGYSKEDIRKAIEEKTASQQHALAMAAGKAAAAAAAASDPGLKIADEAAA